MEPQYKKTPGGGVNGVFLRRHRGNPDVDDGVAALLF